MKKEIVEKNKRYWNDHADLWFGTTALSYYGVRFVTENDLLFSGMSKGKRFWKYHSTLDDRVIRKG